MAHVTMRVTDQEKQVMESYAQLHGVSLSEAMKAAFFEKLENEYDVKAIEEYENEEAHTFYSMGEVIKELEIDDTI